MRTMPAQQKRAATPGRIRGAQRLESRQVGRFLAEPCRPGFGREEGLDLGDELLGLVAGSGHHEDLFVSWVS